MSNLKLEKEKCVPVSSNIYGFVCCCENKHFVRCEYNGGSCTIFAGVRPSTPDHEHLLDSANYWQFEWNTFLLSAWAIFFFCSKIVLHFTKCRRDPNQLNDLHHVHVCAIQWGPGGYNFVIHLRDFLLPFNERRVNQMA